MAYDINLTDGTLFASVQNGTLNRDSNLVIVGKNYAGYGEFVGENFVHLLENAANDTPPDAPLRGQLWYDTGTDILRVYDGVDFVALTGGTGGASDATEVGTDVDNFNNNLSSSDNTVQRALDTLDNLNLGGDASDVTVNTGNFTQNLTAADDTVQKALDTIDQFVLGGGSGSDPTKVPLNGTVPMTGLLTLSGAPTDELHAATKIYVDDLIDGISSGGSVPPGGALGQHLAKKSNVNYDTEWVDPATGGSGGFPAGTKMLFAMTAAPTGWTQNTTESDRMLRLVNDASGGSTGGTNSPIAAHTHAVAGHTHSVNGHSHSLTAHSHTVNGHSHSVGNHSHTIGSHTHSMSHRHVSYMPAHNHPTSGHTMTVTEMANHRHTFGSANDGTIGSSNFTIQAGGPQNDYTHFAGGSASHSHGNTATIATQSVWTDDSNESTTGSVTQSTTGTTSTSATGSTGGTTQSGGGGSTGSASSTTSSKTLTTETGFVPKYINVILATKL